MAEWILLLSQQLLKLSNICSHKMRKDAHATRQLHCYDALVHSIPNLQQTLLLLFMILNAEHLSLIDEAIKMVNSKFARGFIFQ